MGPLIANSGDYTVAALVLLIACKGLAYGVALSGFRGRRGRLRGLGQAHPGAWPPPPAAPPAEVPAGFTHSG